MKAHSGAVGCVEQSCAILPRVGVPPTSTSVVNPPSENPTCLCAFRLTGHEMPILQAYIREQAALVEVDRSDLCDSPHNSGPCSCRPCVSGHHYKTSLDQRKSSVIVTGQRTSCTVRYQNKRQSIPRNLTVDRHSLAERPRGCEDACPTLGYQIPTASGLPSGSGTVTCWKPTVPADALANMTTITAETVHIFIESNL